ncbi:MAG TPA: hypothetical protein VFV08_00340, partial [Puia sp.]|nr:hypothetical protein [Puia sp.]
MFTSFAKRAFDFILFSSLYIASCAVIMVWQTYWLLLHMQPSIPLMGFVFFATVCSYNFHWYLTPFSVSFSQRLAWAHRHKGWHLFLYFVGLSGTFIFFLFIRQHWLALGFGAFITFLYS